jgi:glycosyltransferase involved in cell wall biosynthesis
VNISDINPAHNEEQVIGRLLDALDDGELRSQLDVIVVCNGCTDGTEQAAAGHALGPRVEVVDHASKIAALRRGDAVAQWFPRFYVDADVQITATDLLTMAQTLTNRGLMAVAPARAMDLARSSWGVRRYYQAWESLPGVQEGLYGRGVIGLSEAGYARIAERPDVLGDDLFVHSRFAVGEREVTDTAHAVVHGPLTLRDLVRRRVRTAQGNAQLRATGQGSIRTTRSTARDLSLLVLRRPGLVSGAVVFLSVTVAARLRAGLRSDSTTWLRDESRTSSA